ncbi:MAG: ABC transporter permease [Chloroflexota bacterium]
MTTNLAASQLDNQPINARLTRAARGPLPPTIFWRIREEIPGPLSLLLMVLSAITPFLLWWAVTYVGNVNPVFLPSPGDVGQAFVRLWERGFLTQDIAASFLRVSGGFALAAVVALPVGIVMGSFASIRALFEPLIGILRYMPAPAFIPLFILYMGIDEAPKITLIFVGTVFYNILMIMDAAKFVPKDLIETTYTLGGRRYQALLQVITPYILPNIIDTFRINIAASWNLVVVAELVAAEVGLGKRILIAQKFLNTDEIFANLIMLGVIGFALDLLFRLLQRLLCKWAVT